MANSDVTKGIGPSLRALETEFATFRQGIENQDSEINAQQFGIDGRVKDLEDEIESLTVRIARLEAAKGTVVVPFDAPAVESETPVYVPPTE